MIDLLAKTVSRENIALLDITASYNLLSLFFQGLKFLIEFLSNELRRANVGSKYLKDVPIDSEGTSSTFVWAENPETKFFVKFLWTKTPSRPSTS